MVNVMKALLSFSFFVMANAQANINDGPYVFYRDKQLYVVAVCNGERREKTVNVSQYPTQLSSPCHINDVITIYAAASPAVEQDRSQRTMLVISDIHGQITLAKTLLRAQGVLDNNGRWAFSTRRLVVVGDSVDRGEFVTETLWFLYELQQQAAAVGGEVHVVLGNHEKMLLSGQKKYVHEKYQHTQQIVGLSQAELYGPSSVIGQWLRQQPTIVILGNTLFVHGGISADLVNSHMNVTQINQRLATSLTYSAEQLQSDAVLRLLHGEMGPLWYRGYFREPLIKDDEFERALRQFNVRRIVVGHTTQPHITTALAQRVIVVDAGIKSGQHGEVLWLHDDRCARGVLSGAQEPLPCAIDTVN